MEHSSKLFWCCGEKGPVCGHASKVHTKHRLHDMDLQMSMLVRGRVNL